MSTPQFQIHRSGYEMARRCRRRFFYDYLAKLPGAAEDTPPGLASTKSSPDLAIGSALHAAMEAALGRKSLVECEVAARSAIEEAAKKEWAGCMLGYHEEATAYYLRMAEAMAWVASRVVAPVLLSQYTIHHLEKEMPPIRFEEYPDLEMASRPDAIMEDCTGDVIIGSWKSAASYGVKQEKATLYDTQGLSESVCFYLATGKWPSVQMVYVIKGKRQWKDLPFVQYDGPLTRAYRKEYVKDGSVVYSPKYTSGWSKVPVWDIPGGAKAYWEEHLLNPLNSEHLPYVIPPVATRSKERAMKWLEAMFKDMHILHSRPHVENEFPADESVDSCYAYNVECSWHAPCHGLVQLHEIQNIGPRIPHHERYDDSE